MVSVKPAPGRNRYYAPEGPKLTPHLKWGLVTFECLLYYTYVLVSTDRIMETARKVATGDIVVERGTPYARFLPLREHIYTVDIKRYFAYCGMKKGKIYVTCVNVVEHSDGEVSKEKDWFVILIERTEEGWMAVRTFGKA